MTKDLFKLLNDASIPIEKCPVSPKNFSQLINIINQGDITDKIGRAVLEEMFKTGGGPESIIDRKGLKPIQDTSVLEKILEEVMAENPKAVGKIKEGMTKPIGFLIGEVMKKTNGRANPQKTRELIHKRLPNLS